jgi:hypothetical protein
MKHSAVVSIILACAGCVAVAARAVEPSRASGTVTIDGTTATLAYATSTTVENLFDDSKRDILVVLSDRPLGDLAADDDVALQLAARAGRLVAIAVRADGPKLVDVAVHAKGVEGIQLLPGNWFTFHSTGQAAGTIRLARRESEGHSYACSAEYAGAPARPSVPQEPTAPPQVEPTPTLPPATTSTVDPKTLTAALVAAMMGKDEAQAVKIVKQGVDPNARDQYGTPVLNWAVMMCMPDVVKVLVDKGADLTYERAPGMTILTEAGACPAAAKILRAAGAK